MIVLVLSTVPPGSHPGNADMLGALVLVVLLAVAVAKRLPK